MSISKLLISSIECFEKITKYKNNLKNTIRLKIVKILEQKIKSYNVRKTIKEVVDSIILENKISNFARAKIEKLIEDDRNQFELYLRDRKHKNGVIQISKSILESHNKGKNIREIILKVIEDDLKQNLNNSLNQKANGDLKL